LKERGAITIHPEVLLCEIKYATENSETSLLFAHDLKWQWNGNKQPLQAVLTTQLKTGEAGFFPEAVTDLLAAIETRTFSK
jgi:hypothetical protein